MNNKSKSNSYFKSKPRFNSNFTIRYPDIIVKQDDKVAKDFFTSVIQGEVRKLEKIIIQNSIPISIRRKEDGKNALHIAVDSELSNEKKLNMIQFLLMNHIPVNERDNSNNTPLLLASKNHDGDVVELLLQYNADPTLENEFKIKPLHYASSGILHKCEDIKVKDIIEEPTPKNIDKLEINKLVEDVRKFYNSTLVKFGNLGNVELAGDKKIYDKRISAFLKHNKNIVNKLATDIYFESDYSDLIKDLIRSSRQQISDKTKNINEIRKDLIKSRKDFVNGYFQIIEKIDKQLLEPIDFQPVDHIDNDGLYIRNKFGDNIIKNNKNELIDYWKIHGSPTLNQVLQNKYKEIDVEIDEISDKLNKIANDFNDNIKSLKQEIINSGHQINKLDLATHIIRLMEIATNNVVNIRRINTHDRLRKLFQTSTTEYNLKRIDQCTNDGMKEYGISCSTNNPHSFNLMGGNPPNVQDNGYMDPSNIYDSNLLEGVDIISNFNPFFVEDTAEKRNGKQENRTIDINFKEPYDIDFGPDPLPPPAPRPPRSSPPPSPWLHPPSASLPMKFHLSLHRRACLGFGRGRRRSISSSSSTP